MKLVANTPTIRTIRITKIVSLFIPLIYNLIFIKREIVLNNKKPCFKAEVSCIGTLGNNQERQVSV